MSNNLLRLKFLNLVLENLVMDCHLQNHQPALQQLLYQPQLQRPLHQQCIQLKTQPKHMYHHPFIQQFLLSSQHIHQVFIPHQTPQYIQLFCQQFRHLCVHQIFQQLIHQRCQRKIQVYRRLQQILLNFQASNPHMNLPQVFQLCFLH